MSQAQVEIQLIAAVVAVACALPGVFLVLRRMAMMADAISHTVLLGIVIAFFYTRDLSSPLLIFGADPVHDIDRRTMGVERAARGKHNCCGTGQSNQQHQSKRQKGEAA